MFCVKWTSHVKEIILSKNTFSCLLKFILGYLAFLVINQNIDTQLCMHVKNHQHHINCLKLDYSICLLKLVSNK
jgi:hypothetical protein